MTTIPSEVHQTHTGNFTYKQYVFIPTKMDNSEFLFCGNIYTTFESVMAKVDEMLSQREAEATGE